jgi:hypothetical protein
MCLLKALFKHFYNAYRKSCKDFLDLKALSV